MDVAGPDTGGFRGVLAHRTWRRHLHPSLTVPRTVPLLLAVVAGAVDAETFLALFGLFVAQLTGSFVTVGVQIVTHDPGALIRVLGIPLFFVAGAAIVLVVDARRAPAALALSLTIEALLLIGFMATGIAAAPFASPDAPSAMLAAVFGLLAMGVQSAMVRLMLRGVASTNVMTTNTSQFAIDVTEWLIASWRASRAPQDSAVRQARAGAAGRIASLGPIMAGFFAGSVGGAVGFIVLGLWSLVAVIAIVLGLIGWALRRTRGGTTTPG
jgi:uncharacterized membrane protein YoaK (UPF0700 family)